MQLNDRGAGESLRAGLMAATCALLAPVARAQAPSDDPTQIDTGLLYYQEDGGRVRSIGAEVCIEVTDTGPGIAPADRPFIFDAFFTTKDPGKGTGLGLAISRQIIDGLGGQLQCEPAPGRGTRFIVRLPALPTAA